MTLFWHLDSAIGQIDMILMKPTELALLSGLDHLVEGHYLNTALESRGLRLAQLILDVDNGLHQRAFVQEGLELGQQVVRGDDSGDFRLSDA